MNFSRYLGHVTIFTWNSLLLQYYS